VSKIGILRELWDFLKVRKKWWLTPIVLFLFILGALVVLASSGGGSTLSPFIYTLF
jgi:hypothetical protein